MTGRWVRGRRLLLTVPQVTGAMGHHYVVSGGLPGTPLYSRGPEVGFPGQRQQPHLGTSQNMQILRPQPSTVLTSSSECDASQVRERLRPPQFRSKAFLEKTHKPLTQHLSDDVELTSSNDLWGRITIWDSYDLTLTNSGDSGTLGCSTALGGREVRETLSNVYIQNSMGAKVKRKI